MKTKNKDRDEKNGWWLHGLRRSAGVKWLSGARKQTRAILEQHLDSMNHTATIALGKSAKLPGRAFKTNMINRK
jgi:hypothetical protein